MGKIGEQACVHGVDGLVTVAFQMAFVGGGGAGIMVVFLIAQEMLAQDQVIQRLVPENGQQVRKQGRVVFQLQADGDLDPATVFLPQGENGLHIAVQLCRLHAEPGIVASREDLGRMVGKAQDLQPGGQGAFHIFPLCALGMIAPGVWVW